MQTLKDAIEARDVIAARIPNYQTIVMTDEEAKGLNSVGLFKIDDGEFAGVIVSIIHGGLDEDQEFVVNYRATRLDGSEIDYSKLDTIVMDIVEYMAMSLVVQDMESTIE